MRQQVLNWLATVSYSDMIVAGGAVAFGIAIGWIIWGGKNRYIEELEDELTLNRARNAQLTRQHKADSQRSLDTNDGEEVLQPPHGDRPDMLTPDEIKPPKLQQASTHKGSLHTGAGSHPDCHPSQLSPQLVPDDSGDRQQSASSSSRSYSRRVLEEGQDENLLALSEELDAIRTLLGLTVVDTDPLKESLDQADSAIKRANGRISVVRDTLDGTDRKG